MEDKNKIMERLLEYISGEQEGAAREETRRWIEADEQRKALFEELRREELRLRWGARAALLRGTYARLRARLRRRVFIRRAGVAAAAIAIGALTTALLLRVSPPIEEAPVEEVNLIFPGKPRAVLHLASGVAIAVADTVQAIFDPGIAEIEVKKGGMLSYAEAPGEKPEAMHRVTITRGGEFFVELTDGTRVWLNADSELRYPVTFGVDREVFLRGEAYFEVASGGGRFAVHAGEMEVVALGTAFNVRARGEEVVAALVEGVVEVTAGGERARLMPEQAAEYRPGERLEVRDAETASLVAWKDHSFIFNGQRLEEIMTTLSLWYDVDVVYENEEVKQTRLTGDLMRYEDIRKLLHLFERTSGRIKFEIDGRTITIK